MRVIFEIREVDQMQEEKEVNSNLIWNKQTCSPCTLLLLKAEEP